MSYFGQKTPITKDPLEKLSRVNVLVLDGGAKAAALIRAIFSALGLNNVFIATDGYQGVQIMKEVRIHMIFTDWELKVNKAAMATQQTGQNNVAEGPELSPVSGVKFVERIRRSSLSPNPYIPIVMMMDAASGTDVLKARDSGVNEILLRPINADDFCERLISIIEKPRPFVTAKTYKGPCRRRKQAKLPPGMKERRVKEVRLIKSMTR